MRKNHLSVLAGVLLAAGIFAQEIEEAEIVDFAEIREVTEIAEVAEIVEVVEVESKVIVEKKPLKLDTAVTQQGVQFIKTEYVIDVPKENNGFSGGIGFSLYSFDMSPVRRLISAREKEELSMSDTVKTLRISEYDFLSRIDKREAIPAFHAVFYGINETKFHFGGLFEIGGYSCRNKNSLKDSVVTMGFIFGKAGVLMEQVFLHNDKHYLALGGTVGGGWSGVGFFGRKGTTTFWENNNNNNSRHYDYKDYDYDKDYDDNDKTNFIGAGSVFAFLDVNLSYILSVKKRFHLRFDGLCNIMGSRKGYYFSGNDYGIVNPGGAFSLIWGSKQ
jgi:hypothetical protein